MGISSFRNHPTTPRPWAPGPAISSILPDANLGSRLASKPFSDALHRLKRDRSVARRLLDLRATCASAASVASSDKTQRIPVQLERCGHVNRDGGPAPVLPGNVAALRGARVARGGSVNPLPRDFRHLHYLRGLRPPPPKTSRTASLRSSRQPLEGPLRGKRGSGEKPPPKRGTVCGNPQSAGGPFSGMNLRFPSQVQTSTNPLAADLRVLPEVPAKEGRQRSTPPGPPDFRPIGEATGTMTKKRL